MCPDPQLLSVYLDGELPSPWKEKMETHLTDCSSCMEKLNSYRQFFEKPAEQEIIDAAKGRVWQNLIARRRFQPHAGGLHRAGLWQRKLSIPLPAAAAAAVVIMLMTTLWIRNEQFINAGIASQQTQSVESASFFIAAEDEIPNIMPAADINSVLQFLASDGDVIILRLPELPENRNFSRTGEPAIIRAADYQRYAVHHGIRQNGVFRRVIE